MRIPSDTHLHGHSDGDAIAHAVTDALLGAAAAGDIGEMFSDQDPANRGRDSMEMLRAAVARVRERGFAPQQVDVAVVSEQPRIAPHRAAMRAAVAAAIGVAGGCGEHRGQDQRRDGMDRARRRTRVHGRRDRRSAHSSPGRVSPVGVPEAGTSAIPAWLPDGAARAFLLEPFADFLALERSASRPTQDAYARDLARFVAYAVTHGAGGPAAVPATLVRHYVYHLKDLGLAPASIRRNVSAVRTYYRFLLGDGHVVRDPTERLELPKRWRTLPGVLSVEEVQRLLGAPSLE